VFWTIFGKCPPSPPYNNNEILCFIGALYDVFATLLSLTLVQYAGAGVGLVLAIFKIFWLLIARKYREGKYLIKRYEVNKKDYNKVITAKINAYFRTWNLITLFTMSGGVSSDSSANNAALGTYIAFKVVDTIITFIDAFLHRKKTAATCLMFLLLYLGMLFPCLCCCVPTLDTEIGAYLAEIELGSKIVPQVV
jgi:hypothetical protein